MHARLRIVRFVGRALGAVAVLVVVIGLLLPRLARTPAGREWLLASVRALAPGLEARELDGDLTGEMIFVEVRLRDSAGKLVLRAAKLTVRCHWLALLRGRLHFKRVELVDPELSDHRTLAELSGWRGLVIDELEVRRGPLSLAGRLSLWEAANVELAAEVRETTGSQFAIPELGIREARLWVEGGPQHLLIRGRAVGPELQAQFRAVAALQQGGKRIDVRLRQLTIITPRTRLALVNQPRVLLYPGRLVQVAPAQLQVYGGQIEVRGTFRQRGFPRLVGALRLRDLQLPQLPAGQRASGHAEVTFGRRDLVGAVTLQLSPSQARLDVVVGRLPVRYARGSLSPRVDWARPAELRLQAQRFPLAPLSRVLPSLPRFCGTLDGGAALSGPLNDPTAQASLELREGQWDQLAKIDARLAVMLWQQRTEVHSTVTLSGQRWLQLSGRAAVPLIRVLHRRLGARELEQLRDSPLQLDLEALPHQAAELAGLVPALRRVQGQVGASLRADGTVLQPAAQLQLFVRGARIDRRVRLNALRAELVAQVEQGRTRAELELVEEGQPLLRAEAQAGLDLEGLLLGFPAQWREAPLRVELNAAHVSLARVQRIFGLRPRPAFAGHLLAILRARGTLGQPEAALALSARDLQLNQTPLGSLTASATYARARLLEGGIVLQQFEGGQLSARGRWRPGSGEAPQLRVDGQAVDLNVVQRLVPAIPESAGRLDLHLTLGGPEPQGPLAGELRLTGGRFRFTGVSRIEDVHLAAQFAGQQARLTELRARARGGSLTASGSARLRRLDLTHWPTMPLEQFQLALRADDFALDVGVAEQAKLSGMIDVNGRVAGRLLDAEARVRQGVLRVPRIERRELFPTSPPQDVIFVDQRARAAARAARQPQQLAARGEPLRFRLAVRAEPLLMRGADLTLDAAVNLRVFSDAARRVRLDGRISILRGEITVLGNRFDVQRAEVLFAGEPELNPALNVLLTRRAGDAMISVELTGTVSDPKLAVNSDPPIYDSSQIMSLLVTGRIDEPMAPGAPTDPGLAIAGAISQVLLGSLLRRVVPRIGIDVARVGLGARSRTTGEQALRAEAELGKYITDRIYLAYRRVFGATSDENANEALLEYRISTRWLLMALFGDAGVGGLDLIWSYAY